MKKKILAISTIVLLITVSSISMANKTVNTEENQDECSLCAKLQEKGFRPLCTLYEIAYNFYKYLENKNMEKGHSFRAWFYHYAAEYCDLGMAALNCPNEPDL